MIVAKFGGTSLASAERFCHAANLIRQDPNRRYVVVSAPGKRDDSDIKITDQLHVDGVRRIDTELDAVLTIFVDRVRAENLICLGALSG